MSESEFWSWPAGALALGFVALAHPILTGRLMAVSGIFSRAIAWRRDQDDRQDEEVLAAGDLDEALLAATMAEFGDCADREFMGQEGQVSHLSVVRLPLSVGFTFLVAMAFGGFYSTWSADAFSLRWSFGASFESLVRTDLLRTVLPVVGGILVGFGANMAGGCTSSHGLGGCARFQPGSLVATGAFFLGGVVTSQLLRVVL